MGHTVDTSALVIHHRFYHVGQPSPRKYQSLSGFVPADSDPHVLVGNRIGSGEVYEGPNFEELISKITYLESDLGFVRIATKRIDLKVWIIHAWVTFCLI